MCPKYEKMEWHALFNKIEKEKKIVNVTPLSYQILSISTQENTTPNLRNQTSSLVQSWAQSKVHEWVFRTSSFLDTGFNVNPPYKGEI